MLESKLKSLEEQLQSLHAHYMDNCMGDPITIAFSDTELGVNNQFDVQWSHLYDLFKIDALDVSVMWYFSL